MALSLVKQVVGLVRWQQVVESAHEENGDENGGAEQDGEFDGTGAVPTHREGGEEG